MGASGNLNQHWMTNRTPTLLVVLGSLVLLLIAAGLMLGEDRKPSASSSTLPTMKPYDVEEPFLALPQSANLTGTYRCGGVEKNSEGQYKAFQDDRFYDSFNSFVCFSTEWDKEGLDVPPGSVTATLHLDSAGTLVLDGWVVEEG
jgi:hypothetical protein